MNAQRIDKWLWCVRVFKTRSLATEACRAGKVFVNGQEVKPSREVKTGDLIEVSKKPVLLKLKVLALLPARVGASKVPEFMEDQTPAEEYQQIDLLKDKRFEFRERGEGRPTKRDRRQIDKIKGS